MTAATYNITIEQGAEFQLLLTWNDATGHPIDITGWSAEMMIRQYYTDVTPLVSISSPTSGITLGGALGTIAIDISATVTSTLSVGQCLYDLKMIDGLGKPTRLIQGNVTVTFAVTR